MFLATIASIGFVCCALVAFSPKFRTAVINLNKSLALTPFRKFNEKGKYNVPAAWMGMALMALLFILSIKNGSGK